MMVHALKLVVFKVTVDVHLNIEDFTVKYLYVLLVVIPILGKISMRLDLFKVNNLVFFLLLLLFSKNGGTCILLENNQGRFFS